MDIKTYTKSLGILTFKERKEVLRPISLRTTVLEHTEL